MRVFQPVIQSFDGQTLIGKNGIVKKILNPPAPTACQLNLLGGDHSER
jgi:hypothetical protein